MHAYIICPNRSEISAYLQLEFEEFRSDGRAVYGPVGPGGGESRSVVRVHVRQEEQADVRTLSHLPKVHGKWGMRYDFAIHSSY